MPKDIAVTTGLNVVNPPHYGGWSGVPVVQPMKFAPASRMVDWTLIRKHLPGEETKESPTETPH